MKKLISLSLALVIILSQASISAANSDFDLEDLLMKSIVMDYAVKVEIEPEVLQSYSVQDVRKICRRNPYLSEIVHMYVKNDNYEVLDKLYVFEEDAEYLALLDKKVEDFKAGISSSATDIEKILYLNTYLCSNYEYDYTQYRKSSQYIGSQELPYCIKTGKAICWQYSALFCFFAKQIGIESSYVGTETHAWNVVKCDGKWYHIDTTWNDGRNGCYILSDEESKTFHGVNDFIIENGVTCPDSYYKN